jgi:EmrB/QacA subfamily drug resistance transporter
MVSSRSSKIAVVVLCTGIFLTTLDITIVNVAIPSMLTSLQAPLDQILWVVNGYMLAYGALLITAGRLGDLFGQRTIFITGLGLFVAASLCCGLSQNAFELIGSRVLQGAGSALITATSLALLTSLFPPERRGAALGIYASVAALASVVGPTGGGLLIAFWGWRWTFFLNIPLGLLAIGAAFAVLPHTRLGKRHQLDIGGIILSTAGLFSIMFALIDGQNYNWGTFVGPLTIPEMIVGGFVILVCFVIWEHFQAEPLLPLTLFKNRAFSIMSTVNISLAFGQLGFMFLISLYLQTVLGMSALAAGLTIVPLMVAIMVASPLAGRFSDKIGGKYILIAGLLLFAGGISLTAWMSTTDANWYSFLLPLLVTGCGIGCAVSTVMGEAMRDIKPPLMGSAAGVISATRQVGGGIGAAVVGGVLQNRLAVSLQGQAHTVQGQLPPQLQIPFTKQFSKMLQGGLQVGASAASTNQHIPGLSSAQTQQLQQALYNVLTRGFVDAFHPTLLLVAFVLLLGMFISFLLKRKRTAKVAPAPSLGSQTEVSAKVSLE